MDVEISWFDTFSVQVVAMWLNMTFNIVGLGVACVSLWCIWYLCDVAKTALFLLEHISDNTDPPDHDRLR